MFVVLRAIMSARQIKRLKSSALEPSTEFDDDKDEEIAYRPSSAFTVIQTLNIFPLTNLDYLILTATLLYSLVACFQLI